MYKRAPAHFVAHAAPFRITVRLQSNRTNSVMPHRGPGGYLAEAHLATPVLWIHRPRFDQLIHTESIRKEGITP